MSTNLNALKQCYKEDWAKLHGQQCDRMQVIQKMIVSNDSCFLYDSKAKLPLSEMHQSSCPTQKFITQQKATSKTFFGIVYFHIDANVCSLKDWKKMKFWPDDNICKPRNVNLLIEKLKYHQNTPQTTKMSTFNTNPPNLLHQSKPGWRTIPANTSILNDLHEE